MAKKILMDTACVQCTNVLDTSLTSVLDPKSFHFVCYQNQNDWKSGFFFAFFPILFVEIVNENDFRFRPDQNGSTI